MVCVKDAHDLTEPIHYGDDMMDLGEAVLTEHAATQMAKRHLSEAGLRLVLSAPERVRPVRPGRVVAQRLIDGYLVRVFVDVDRAPPEVVTAYRTSKIEKYGKQS